VFCINWNANFKQIAELVQGLYWTDILTKVAESIVQIRAVKHKALIRLKSTSTPVNLFILHLKLWFILWQRNCPKAYRYVD